MADLERLYTFADATGEVISSQAIDDEFDQLVARIGNLTGDDLSDALAAELGVSQTSNVRGGYLSIPGEETRTNTALGYMPTPDVINDVVVETGDVIRVRYVAQMKSLTALKIANATLTIDGVAVDRIGSTANVEASESAGATNYALLTTVADPDVGLDWPLSAAPTFAGNQLMPAECIIAPASGGSYDIGVQFASESGSAGVRVKDRRLWVKVEGH